MTIGVGRRQFVMDILCRGKRGKPEEDTDHPQRHSRTEQGKEAPGLYRQRHHAGQSVDILLRFQAAFKLRRR